ncbi:MULTISPECIES: transposase [unclassified Microcoleus]|uniref:transposase n=1 Tax=unclassified Microcoleus TaxID=2642155 RepID=UPI00403F8FD7
MSQKKKTRPPVWTKRQLLNGIFYQLKNGCNWADLPKDLPPYSTVFWHYQNWCEDGSIERIETALHGKVRCANKSKKTAVDDLDHVCLITAITLRN